MSSPHFPDFQLFHLLAASLSGPIDGPLTTNISPGTVGLSNHKKTLRKDYEEVGIETAEGEGNRSVRSEDMYFSCPEMRKNLDISMGFYGNIDI